jgi:hypothetical protein
VTRTATEAPRSTAADRAFLLACRAFDQDIAAVLERLSPAWRDRLRGIPEAARNPAPSLETLRQSLHQEAHPDLERIHPSWWVRALQDESPTVKRAVAAYGPEPIRDRLRNELELKREEVVPARKPHPEVVACLRALWAEPFVGGPPLGEADPPIVRALVGLGRHEVARLVALTGLAKLAAIPDGPAPPAATGRIAARLAALRALWREPDPRWVEQARADVAATEGNVVANLPRLGLITVGRLLGRIDPHRARWALQHLPYGIAKAVRPYMEETGPRSIDPAALDGWESRVLALARQRLADELAMEGPS